MLRPHTRARRLDQGMPLRHERYCCRLGSFISLGDGKEGEGKEGGGEEVEEEEEGKGEEEGEGEGEGGRYIPHMI